MKSGNMAVKRILFIGLLIAVGAALEYFNYWITPAIGDRSVSFSEYRSRSRLGGAVGSIGAVFLVVAFLITFSRFWRRPRTRHHREIES